ncbi:MAG: class I SAM-dependent methyltransferase [Magnetococcus sp. DMHC-8]
MTNGFKDHFSAVATHYLHHRPAYPSALFDWLANQCEAHDLAWDCGAGSGQAAIELGRLFKCVLATDASAAQIAQAVWHPRVTYRQAQADGSGLDDRSVDLVVVAQALHWFALEPFYAEVRRVLKPAGLLAVWSYGVLHVADDAVDALVQRFYQNDVGPYWPSERRHVENGYRELAFPFCPVATPAFTMNVCWTLSQLLGYFRSWSATARYIQARGCDPVGLLEPHLRASWGDAEQPRTVAWPLALRVGRLA